jgi:hypothetical protein
VYGFFMAHLTITVLVALILPMTKGLLERRASLPSLMISVRSSNLPSHEQMPYSGYCGDARIERRDMVCHCSVSCHRGNWNKRAYSFTIESTGEYGVWKGVLRGNGRKGTFGLIEFGGRLTATIFDKVLKRLTNAGDNVSTREVSAEILITKSPSIPSLSSAQISPVDVYVSNNSAMCNEFNSSV